MGTHGSVRLNLNKLIEEKGISKTKLCYRAELQCEIGDLLEFIPADKNDG